MISLHRADIGVLGAVTEGRRAKAPFYAVVSSAFLSRISCSELIVFTVPLQSR